MATGEYDTKIPLNVRRKCYKTILRPAIVNGFECWAINKKEEIKSDKNAKMDVWCDQDRQNYK